MSEKKLLMLCYRAPYPLKSGSEIRMYQFLEILSEKYEITLLYLQEGEETADPGPLCEKCGQVEKFRVAKWRRYAQAVAGYLFLGHPLQIGYFRSKAMQRWVNAHIGEYEDVLCMHVRTIQYVLGLSEEARRGKRIFLDGIDAVTLNYYNSYRTSRGIRRLVNRMEYRRMAGYERKAYSFADQTILISERDRDYIVRRLRADCSPAVIFNYAIDYGYLPEIRKQEYTIAFMGKMNYAPNVDAVLFFVKKYFHGLKRRYPELELRIIGGNAAPEIRRLEQTEGIRLLGFVENPARHLQEASVVIAPMISGSGLQNKIVQAMYLGCAVLATPIGADGLKDVTERELIIAGQDEIGEKLAYFLRPEAADERRQIGQNARAYIGRYYSREKIERDIWSRFDFEKVI